MEPRFGTVRSGRVSRGGEVGQVAGLLGLPLLPWQQHVVDVALELEGGVPVYRSVTVTVPRQCGKTWLVAVLMLHRLLFWGGPQVVVYGAQSLVDAAGVWEGKLWPLLSDSGLAKRFGLRLRRSLGNFGLVSDVGSSLRVLAKSSSAGHGATVGLAVSDEAMALTDNRREQALLPAMRTVGDAQFWVVSTAGDASSSYLRRKVDVGRDLVVGGGCEGARHAYFEWGLGEDEDWTDESKWGSAVPVLGETVSLEDLRHERATSEAVDFRRMALNQWPTEGEASAVPWEEWLACKTGLGPSGRLWVGVDAPPRRNGVGAVVVAGGGVLEVVASSQSHRELAEVVLGVLGRWGDEIGGVGFVSRGPMEVVGRNLELSGSVPVVWLPWPELAGACERFFDAVLSRQVGVVGSAASRILDRAVKDTDTSDRATGSWLWRAKKGRTVAPLWAATVAYELDWRSRNAPVPVARGPLVTGPGSFDSAELDRLAGSILEGQ